MPKLIRAAALIFAFLSLSIAAAAQGPQLMKRVTTKTDRLDFGSGGTVSITGAPAGSIRIVGSRNNEIEITAEIEVQASNEADLAALAAVTTFVTQEGLGKFSVISVGEYNKLADNKKTWKKLPKNLRGLPVRIDYVLSVPKYCDLLIDGGKGDFFVSGIDGTMRINFVESNAKLELIGGAVSATFGSGTVNVDITERNWRGRVVEIQVASGDMNVTLPANLSAELDAAILRTGKIENTFPGLKPRVRTAVFTDKSIAAKAGNGGVPVKFTVGDGTLTIKSH